MDDATREELIAQYRQGHAAVLQALEGISDEELDRRPPGDAWSARRVVHHLADSEMTSAIRLRRLIAEDEPRIQGYDEAGFAERLFYDERPIEPSLECTSILEGDDERHPGAPRRGPLGSNRDARGERTVLGRGVARDLRGARSRARRPDPSRPAGLD